MASGRHTLATECRPRVGIMVTGPRSIRAEISERPPSRESAEPRPFRPETSSKKMPEHPENSSRLTCPITRHRSAATASPPCLPGVRSEAVSRGVALVGGRTLNSRSAMETLRLLMLSGSTAYKLPEEDEGHPRGRDSAPSSPAARDSSALMLRDENEPPSVPRSRQFGFFNASASLEVVRWPSGPSLLVTGELPAARGKLLAKGACAARLADLCVGLL